MFNRTTEPTSTYIQTYLVKDFINSLQNAWPISTPIYKYTGSKGCTITIFPN